MFNNRRTRRVLVGVAALGLVASACSNDDSDTDAESATTQAPAATAGAESATPSTMAPADSEASAPAAGGDIVDTAVGAGDFTTLVTAVQAAELEETLRGEGPFTVFAPTDDAFAALPAGTVDTLLADPTGDLTDILTYHVVPGEVLAADVAGLDGEAVTTVNGATFTVGVADDGAVTLTDGAGNEVSVVATDVQADNGVIHVIDGVLLPA
jgi:uncharacterized surface protein with fasciclin (FAS1) repeats